ncbi:heterokaryon incompatibility protein-domain-containing protein [Nemania abortiva]|nr:heterokaryon incompatibility protein-domain-containing protein [Nemania abortiva]
MTQAGEPEPELDTDDWDEYVQLCLCRAPAYPYRTLLDNDIRLFYILPGDGILECVLHQMPLVEEQVFRAVSYVWGDEFETEQILLDGEPFSVSRNLHELLHQLREQPESPVKIGYPDDYFWVDAICLNQKDFEEKSRQVPRMMDIYNAALRVIIWLGPNKPLAKSEKLRGRANSSTTNPVEFLRRGNLSADSVIGLLFEKASSLWTDWELPDDEAEEEPVLRAEFGDSYGAVLQASAELLMRPWFMRAWTVQEYSLVVGSTILAGRHGVYAEDLIKILKVFSSHHRLILLTSGYTRIHALGLIERAWLSKYNAERQGQQPENMIAECILEILSYITNAQATDPRDQVYALLGLVRFFVGDNLPIELEPNYHLPYDVIYWHYAAYLLQHSGDLRLLLSHIYKLRDVPSWVPDFRQLSLHEKANCESTVQVSQDKRVLHLQGIRMEPICDKVDEWEDPRFSATGIPPGLQHRIRYVEGRIFKLASHIRSISLQEILDDFFWKSCRLFTQGGVHGTRRAYTDLKGHSGRNGAWLSKRERAKTTDAFGKGFTIADEIRHSVVLLDDGTIISVRRTGVEIMLDDLVCIFKGATYPMIVRPPKQGDGFTLVSHCEIMSGTFSRQLFDDNFWASRKLEEFRVI